MLHVDSYDGQCQLGFHVKNQDQYSESLIVLILLDNLFRKHNRNIYVCQYHLDRRADVQKNPNNGADLYILPLLILIWLELT